MKIRHKDTVATATSTQKESECLFNKHLKISDKMLELLARSPKSFKEKEAIKSFFKKLEEEEEKVWAAYEDAKTAEAVKAIEEEEEIFFANL